MTSRLEDRSPVRISVGSESAEGPAPQLVFSPSYFAVVFVTSGASRSSVREPFSTPSIEL